MAFLLQVMMLSSVPELHGYIDKAQLTEDLGGTLDYCHTRWLCHRTVSPSHSPHGCWPWAVVPVNPQLIHRIVSHYTAFSKDMFPFTKFSFPRMRRWSKWTSVV